MSNAKDLPPADPFHFSPSLTRYSRMQTRVVQIGDVPMGGSYPIRVQSMTTTDTMDTRATVDQSIRMIKAGSEYIRITAPSLKEAENLAQIKSSLRHQGFSTPLVADIHFTPNAAEMAARIVEKVRINPGNYADKKKFQQLNYTEHEYSAELERISERFTPLVKICKEYGTAMRIGTNHGSLSDRIMSYYGDTPRGMVESAMEFIRICEREKYFNLVISMKASNPKIMVQAYRLLVHTMLLENMNYPLHLGVTEAGDGEDGRIKSSAGIGTLLEDGLGDTIRVSLTEEPEAEIPVALALASRYSTRRQEPTDVRLRFPQTPPKAEYPVSPFSYARRKTIQVDSIGDHQVPRVVADISRFSLRDPTCLKPIGYTYSMIEDKYHIMDLAADIAYVGDEIPSFQLPGNLKLLINYPVWKTHQTVSGGLPFISLAEYPEYIELFGHSSSSRTHFILTTPAAIDQSFLDRLRSQRGAVLVLQSGDESIYQPFRQVYFTLMAQGIETPVLFRKAYAGATAEEELLDAATDFGGLFIDGFGDGLWLETMETAFGILQACRTRISKTEYISCPSCGRTLFDLQEVTQLIRSKTGHLKGVKIAIMGCIVNGPGEMADADYGYVGSGPGKITLYRAKEVLKKNVDADQAVDELIKLIEQDGNWVELPAQ